MNEEIREFCIDTVVSGNEPFYIVGRTLIAITLIICVTVLLFSLLKIIGQELHHKSTLYDAEKIKNNLYNDKKKK